MKVSPVAEYLVNVKPGSVYVTLISNSGVTKSPRSRPVIDPARAVAVTVSYQGNLSVKSASDIKNHRQLNLQNGTDVAITLPAGEVAILEFKLD